MLLHLPPIRSLLLGTALLLTGNGLMSTLVALRGSIEGFSDQTLGLMGSIYFVGFLVGTWTTPKLIRRIGHIRAFTFFASSLAAMILLHSLLLHPVVWMVLRLITGIALVGFYTIIESWLNSRSAPETRGQVFAAYMVVNMAALAGAQQLLHVAAPDGFELFTIAAIMVCLSVLPLASTRQPQPEIHRVPRLKLSAMWRAAPMAVVACVVSGLSIGTFWSLGPLYATRLGYDASGVAMLMTVIIVGGALLQVPLGRLSDRYDRRYALALAAGGAAIGAGLMAVSSNLPNSLLAASFLFGGMAFALYPISIAHLIDHLTHEQILSGNAGMLFLHSVGAIIGPSVAGTLMVPLGAPALPLFFAAALLPLVFIIALNIHRQQVDYIVEDPAEFVAMIRTAPTAVEMVAAVEEHRLETVHQAEQEAAHAPQDSSPDAEAEADAPEPAPTDEAGDAPPQPTAEAPESAPDSSAGDLGSDETADKSPENAPNTPQNRS